ncbi:TPA_asm: P [Fraxinus gammacytorhabdovirus 1]|nr:TPA_asm: P [Fraxinus gammacytorhabdovirus 1]
MDEKQILKQLSDSAAKVKAGRVGVAFKNLPDLAPDSTSPLTNTAEQIASDITNLLPNPASSSQKSKSIQSRKDIKDLLIKTSAATGVTADEVHVEDLLLIANSTQEPLTYRDVFLYMRGVSKANQVSMTTALSKVVGNIESMLSKNQQTMQRNIDSNKLINEKMSVIGTKIDNISPMIISTLSAEHSEIRSMITTRTEQSSTNKKASESGEVSSNVDTPRYPNSRDLIVMCRQMGCPDQIAVNYGEKLEGIVSWEEYRLVLSGTISREAFRSMLSAWKTIKEST